MVHIKHPTAIPGAGTKPKRIEEYIGRVNSQSSEVSIARMTSPEGWEEPAQRPEFDEYTLVLAGALYVESEGRKVVVRENEAIIAEAGSEVRYSTPEPGGAEYIAVCLPAFSPESVHRSA